MISIVNIMNLILVVPSIGGLGFTILAMRNVL